MDEEATRFKNLEAIKQSVTVKAEGRNYVQLTHQAKTAA